LESFIRLIDCSAVTSFWATLYVVSTEKWHPKHFANNNNVDRER